MLKLKTFAIRLIMTILFLGALSTTVQTISGVEIQTVISSMDNHIREDSGASNNHHTLGLSLFSLNQAVKARNKSYNGSCVKRNTNS